jgi:hypothetical protein
MAINKRYLTVGMVSFIDLLGFSARVMSIRTSMDLEKIERDICRIQAWFDNRPSDEALIQSQRIISKKVQAFSDCLVISVSSRSELAESQGDFDVLMGEITSLGMAQSLCAANGIFVRGGSDYGVWYKRRDAMISPAMVQAYELERKACVPMIAVGRHLYEHLSEHKHRKYYSEDFDPVPKCLRFYKNLPNGQEHWFIDYLPILLDALDGKIAYRDQDAYRAADRETKNNMRSAAYLRDCLEATIRHRDAIRSAHEAAVNATIRSKYEWLASYHDDAVHRFFKEPDSDLFCGLMPTNDSSCDASCHKPTTR